MAGDWVEGFSEKHQKKYWKNKKTKETTWKKPSDLESFEGAFSEAKTAENNESDWIEGYSTQHKKKYWKNKVTGEKTWKQPKPESNSTDETTKPAEIKKSKDSSKESTATTADEWDEKLSAKHNKKFWQHKTTGEKSWKPPKTEEPSKPTSTEQTQKPDANRSTLSPTTEEWEEKFSAKHNKKFWVHKITGEKSWKSPNSSRPNSPMPPGDSRPTSPVVDPKGEVGTEGTTGTGSTGEEWEEKFSAKHNKKFWVHKTTGEKSWKAPMKLENLTPTTSVSGEQRESTTGASVEEEWEEKFSSKHNKKFWQNKKTGEKSWKEPLKPTLATGSASEKPKVEVAEEEWEEKFSNKHNKKFWQNKKTGEKSWKEPKIEKTEKSGIIDATSNEEKSEMAVEDEWEEKFSAKKNKKYWENKKTGEKSWKPPPITVKPVGSEEKPTTSDKPEEEWEEKFNQKHNKKYWVNKKTGEKSWKPPTKLSGESSQEPSRSSSPAESMISTFSEDSKALAASSSGPAYSRGVGFWAETDISTDNFVRCLIELRGCKEATELEIFQIQAVLNAGLGENKAEEKSASSSSSPWKSVHTFQLKTVSFLCCNQLSGQLKIELNQNPAEKLKKPEESATEQKTQPGSEVQNPTPNKIILLFSCDAISQTWFQSIMQRLNLSPEAVVSSEASASVLNLKERRVTFADAAAKEAAVKAAADALVDKKPVCIDYSGTVSTTVSKSTKLIEGVVGKDEGEAVFSHGNNWCKLLSAHFLANCTVEQLKIEADWLLSNSEDQILGSEKQLINECREQLEKVLQTADDKMSSEMSSEPNESNTLPYTGFLVLQAINTVPTAGHSKDTPAISSSGPIFSADGGGWMSSWASIDRGAHTITFHDHGPGTPASLILDVAKATLHVPDLTDPSKPWELHLHHCNLKTLKVRHPVSLAFVFQHPAEFFRWALPMAAICLNFSYYCSGMLTLVPPKADPLQQGISGQTLEEIAKKAHRSASIAGRYLAAMPTNHDQNFPLGKRDILDICLGLFDIVTERQMVKGSVRKLRLSGAQVKSARFIQLNQRVVVLSKGMCTNLTEGSVLLSVNGLSAVTMPTATILKFISELPRQMNVDIFVWKFPRAEFHVSLVEIESPLNFNAAHTIIPPPPDPVSSPMGGRKGLKRPEDETHLHKVIMKKRSSILKMPQGGDALDHLAAMKELEGSSTNTNGRDTRSGTSDSKKITLNDFTRAEKNTILWKKSRLMIASGNLTLLPFKKPIKPKTNEVEPDESIRFQLSSCQVKLVYPLQGIGLRELAVDIQDSRTHVVLQCPSFRALMSLLEYLMVATKLMGSFPVDLGFLFDQAGKWQLLCEKSANNTTLVSQRTLRRSLFMGDFKEENTENSVNPTTSLLTQSIVASGGGELNLPTKNSLTPAKTPTKEPNSEDIEEFDNTRSLFQFWGKVVEQASKTGVLSTMDEGIEEEIRDNNMLQTAEELEKTLSDLHLPLAFPTFEIIEKQVQDLFKQCRVNHKLLAEFLVTQFDILNPTEVSQPSVKTAIISFNDMGIDEEADASNENSQSGVPEAPWDMRKSLMQGSTSGRRSSRLSMSIDISSAANQPSIQNQGPPPPPPEIPNRMDELGDLLQAPPNNPVQEPETPAPLPQPVNLVTKEDRKALSSVLHYLINSPKDIVSLAHKLTHIPDVEYLAFIEVNRLCSGWSTEQKPLESLIYCAAEKETHNSAAYRLHRLARCMHPWSHGFTSSDNPYTAGDQIHLIQTPTYQKDYLPSAYYFGHHDRDSVSFLQLLLFEVSRRLDVVAYFQSFCSEINIESLSADSGVADLCTRIVEPYCRRFEASASAGLMPGVLRGALRALSSCSNSHISPIDLLADCVTPHVIHFIFKQNRRKFIGDDGGYGGNLSFEQIHVVVERVKDLLQLALDQEVARKVSLCLSDKAALSRSKWFISRCIEIGTKSELTSNRQTVQKPNFTSSPVAQLAKLAHPSGKSLCMLSLVALRPSELHFLLSILNLADIGSSPISATSRELSEAVSHLSATDFLKKLQTNTENPKSQEGNNNPVPEGESSALPRSLELFKRGSNGLNKTHAFVLYVDNKSFSEDPMFDVRETERVVDPGGQRPIGQRGNDDIHQEEELLLAPSLVTDGEDSTSAESSLAGIQWLISAARSALRSVFEQKNLSKSSSTIQELRDLQDKLSQKRDVIKSCLADLKRLNLCSEWCSNVKSQIRLLLDQSKAKKKYNANGAGNYTKEDEYETALAKMVQLQLEVEKQLEYVSASSIGGSAAVRNGTPFIKQLQNHLAAEKRSSKLATLSAKNNLKINTYSSSSITQFQQGGDNNGSPVGVGGSLSRAPNPLWVVMQNVFNSSSSGKKN